MSHHSSRCYHPHDEFSRMLSRLFAPSQSPSSSTPRQWSPRVDIAEQEDRFLIQADVPGVDPKEIEIHMEDGVLIVKGERGQESKESANGVIRAERVSGVFQRRFALPDSADVDGISATGNHGVLEITIPKLPETKPRRIQVQ